MRPLDLCRIIEFPKVADRRGNLTFIDGGIQIPFRFQRVYYLYDVPGGESRGGHAHRKLEQVIIALAGSFDVLLNDGMGEERFRLSLPNFGLYIPTMVWREIELFSSGSVCLVLASSPYDESEYIRDYEEFQRNARGKTCE